MPDSTPPEIVKAAEYSVAVRELCEFTAKAGDLDLRFTPAPTAQQGIDGHGKVADRRGSSYQKEVRLESQYENLRIRGRADGYDSSRNELEEIKTYRGRLDRIPENHRALHWAQLKVYGAMLCAVRDLSEVRLTLVYFEIDRERETPISQVHTAEDLKAFFTKQCQIFLRWSESEIKHQTARNHALSRMAFPYPQFHAGQRQVAEAVYRSCRDGQSLMIEAPTGIGKSIGTLFPSLKSLSAGHLDKVFYLTAKTSGRRMAIEAVEALRQKNEAIPLRLLELVAREKVCEHPDKACHGDSCPLAKGFYDRLPAARDEAILQPELTQAGVRAVALRHSVCPYYLSQDLVRWSDVIVGDYNYYFDQSALLHGFTLINEWRVALLVDETHNLVERGRGMYSAALDQWKLSILRKQAAVPIKQSLNRLHRAWNSLWRDQVAEYQIYNSIPKSLTEALLKVIKVVGETLSENPATPQPALQEFYFDALNFLHLAETIADHSLFDITIERAPLGQRGKSSTLCIRNVVPAPFLAKRLETAHAAMVFSATLQPPHFYRDMIGLPAETRMMDVASPFSNAQLDIRTVKNVSTRYRDRATSIDPIVELIGTHYLSKPGNYLAYFSSFAYLRSVSDRFADRYPDVPIHLQGPRMSEVERGEFLKHFEIGGARIGFAVLGGVFSEGIDLPGDRLVGAFVATLGLPQINPINEAMRKRMDQLFGAGYDYAYLYPGLQKVVQAAGRVIRTLNDRGDLYLIDDRFARSDVRRLLPRWWGLSDLQARH